MGGGAIRTAAKAAALTGYRSNVARRATSLSNSTAASSTVHMAHDGETSPLVLSNRIEGGTVQMPVWELDSDWEEVSGLGLDPVIDPPPRLIFGPTPSLEEAKEATKDLKEAIDGVYFTNLGDAKASSSQISDSGSTTLVTPTPKHVAQAFSLLQGCSETQFVVASIASDPNVWNAVLKNNEVMSFITKQQSATLPNVEAESMGENESSESVNFPDDDTTKPSMFSDIMQNIKVRVSTIVSNISDILQDFMGPSADSTQGDPDTKHDKGFFSENTLGASFMALAVAVILLVLLKRG